MKTKFELDDDDAALVLHKDGSMELYMGSHKDDHKVCPLNQALVAAISCRVTDSEWCSEQLSWLQTKSDSLPTDPSKLN